MIGLALAALGCLHADARNSSLQDTPVAVSALDGSSLDFTSVKALQSNTIRDLQVLVPARIATIGNSNGTASFDDSRYYFSDFNRIEVLQGPQGTLFGRNESSGFTATLGAGYNGNITNDPFDKHSTSYLTAALSYQYSREILSQGRLDLGVSAQYTQYGSEVKWGYDRLKEFNDFSAYASYNTELSPSAELDLDLSLFYGEHGTIPGGFNWAGPLSNYVLSIDGGAEVTWRADGQDVDSSGFTFRTGLRYNGFDEKDNDSYDLERLTFTQEILYNFDGGNGLYFRGEYIDTEFDEMYQCDSEGYRATLGFFAPLPCGTDIRLGGGIERFDYDDPYLDDDTELILELLLGGAIGRGFFSLGAQYRTFQNFPNWGGKWGVDMQGLQIGGRVTHPVTDKVNIRFSLESVHLDGNISDDADNSLSFQSGSVGLGYTVNENTSVDISTGIDRSSVDSGGGNSETRTSWRSFIGVRYEF